MGGWGLPSTLLPPLAVASLLGTLEAVEFSLMGDIGWAKAQGAATMGPGPWPPWGIPMGPPPPPPQFCTLHIMCLAPGGSIGGGAPDTEPGGGAPNCTGGGVGPSLPVAEEPGLLLEGWCCIMGGRCSGGCGGRLLGLRPMGTAVAPVPVVEGVVLAELPPLSVAAPGGWRKVEVRGGGGGRLTSPGLPPFPPPPPPPPFITVDEETDEVEGVVEEEAIANGRK